MLFVFCLLSVLSANFQFFKTKFTQTNKIIIATAHLFVWCIRSIYNIIQGCLSIKSTCEQASLLALNGGGRFLSPSSPLSSLLCSLVSWETLSALLSKLKYYGLTGLLMQLTPSKLGFRGTWLPWRNVRSRLFDGAWERWRIVCLAALSVEDIDMLPFSHHDNRYFADWIRLCPGLLKNSENGNSLSKAPQAARMIEAVGRAVSIETVDYNRNMDSTQEKFTALQRKID